MARKANNQSSKNTTSYLEKLDREVKSNQSKLSMILGALIILVVGILIFNYFSRGRETLGPAQQIQQAQEGDVSPENLPGKYTVKEEDTLFLISEKYYKDGYKYTEIAKENNITNMDSIEVGQVLQIPKLEALVTAVPSPSPEVTPTSTQEPLGKGGADTTIWGPRITEDTYTVVEGDWLSKIAGRAYGDIFAYKKLAEVNNIPNPDLIFPGQVLKIPR